MVAAVLSKCCHALSSTVLWGRDNLGELQNYSEAVRLSYYEVLS